jgi:hypothetical protein
VTSFLAANAAFPLVAPGEPLDTNPQFAHNNSRSEVVERHGLGRWLRWLRRTR